MDMIRQMQENRMISFDEKKDKEENKIMSNNSRVLKENRDDFSVR